MRCSLIVATKNASRGEATDPWLTKRCLVVVPFDLFLLLKVINHKELEFRMYYHALDPDTKKFRVGEWVHPGYHQRGGSSCTWELVCSWHEFPGLLSGYERLRKSGAPLTSPVLTIDGDKGATAVAREGV